MMKISVCVCIYPTLAHKLDIIQDHFWVVYFLFELRVFFLLGRFPKQGGETKSALLFTYSWEKTWIHAFPKGIG